MQEKKQELSLAPDITDCEIQDCKNRIPAGKEK